MGLNSYVENLYILLNDLIAASVSSKRTIFIRAPFPCNLEAKIIRCL